MPLLIIILLNSFLRDALESHKKRGLWRTLHNIESPQGPEIVIDGKKYINFSSNDYLGLAAHPAIQESLCEGVRRYGVGAGASHYICGHFESHEALCASLADFCQRQRVVLFSSGYMANLGVIGALLKKGGGIYLDALNHVSLLDAARLCRGDSYRFKHNNSNDLEHLLKTHRHDKQLVAVDGVFSMDGDIAPLQALAQISKQYKASLMIDDAHGFGVLGTHGRGSLEHCGIGSAEVPLLMATMGKAMGVFGAFVAGDGVWIDAVEQFARTAIYTTALPPALAHAAVTALEIVRRESDRRERLQTLIYNFRSEAQDMGLNLMNSMTPIQPIIIGDASEVLALSVALREHGIWLAAIRPPTVPEGTARLRLSFSATHSDNDLEKLLIALKKVMANRPIYKD